MQCRLLGQSTADRQVYDDFIAACSKGHVLQTWQWGQLKEKGQWRAWRLLVEDEGMPKAAVTLLERPLPGPLGCFFYAPRGPVLEPGQETAWDCLMEGISKLGRKRRTVFCKIDPDILAGDPIWQERLRRTGFRNADRGEGFEGVQPRYVFRLDINPGEEELLANMQQKTRYNLRLAERKGVDVQIGAPKEQLPVFYKLLEETAARDSFLIRGYSYYEDFYDLLVPDGLAELAIVRHEEEAIAGALLFRLKDKAWYIYGASANNKRNLMPNYLMQWRMIQWAKKEGCAIYDFRGVPGDVGPEHPLYGLVKFKKGFGGDYCQFIGEWDLVFRPFLYNLYNRLEPWYQRNIRKAIRAGRKVKQLIKR